MWKRIHSNRDPRDTLYSEITKEFGTYFTKARGFGKNLFNSYPRFFMGAMILLMLVSMVLSFTIFRSPTGTKTNTKIRSNPVQDGFTQIMAVSGHIRETIRLKAVVDSLSAKKQLSHADSALLDSALDRLSSIHRKTN